MKVLITILGLLNGGYMLLDGIYVLLKGKYIGPEKPGPWANLFYKLKIDVFNLAIIYCVRDIVVILALLFVDQSNLDISSWTHYLHFDTLVFTSWDIFFFDHPFDPGICQTKSWR